jgi:flagellar biosynthesis protein FliQ
MQELNMLLEPVRALLQQTGAFLPRLLVAAGVLIVGWLLAKAARFAVVKALRAFNFHVLTERAGIDNFLQQGGTEKDATDLFGVIVYWAVILAALIVASNGLGLSQVTELLTRVVLFLPKVLVALVLLIFGAYFGRFVGQAITTYLRNAEIPDADLLGHAVQSLLSKTCEHRHRACDLTRV